MVKVVTVTPDAPHNYLDDLRARYNIHPERVGISKQRMKQHASKRQLERAKQYQRRTH
jgi:hypothetical protein